jgi:hypothetical protein
MQRQALPLKPAPENLPWSIENTRRACSNKGLIGRRTLPCHPE